jgi:hypothetical protein
VVVIPRSEEQRFTDMCRARALPATRIGVVDSGLGVDAGRPGEQLLVIGTPQDDLVFALPELAASRDVLAALLG